MLTSVLSAYPMWWFALPLLLLPVWWHRRKRQRLTAEPLATARFLPNAAPEQLRIWRWRDRILLLVRCLLLLALIAWLAATIFPWRGDTVLFDASADQALVERQISAAGLSAAARLALPAEAMPNALQWLREHERDWRPDARLLIVAASASSQGQVAMPARLPRFRHQVELRTVAAPVGAAASVATPYRIAMATVGEREAAWHALFAAFDQAGGAARRHTTVAAPDAGTMLLVWDSPAAAPPAAWRAPHWWIGKAARGGFPELAKASTLTVNGIGLTYADSPRGRLWSSDAFPPRDAATARALYEAWRLLDTAPAQPYAAPSQRFTVSRAALPASADAKPAPWLAYALLAMFLLERILAHARRN